MGLADDPLQLPNDPQLPPEVAAALAVLTARVYTLERQLAQLRDPDAVPPARHAPSPIPSPAPPVGPPPTRSIPAFTLPPRPVEAPNFTKAPPPPQRSLGDLLGSQIFNRIGIIALLIATTLFLRWAIDNHWIGPLGRVAAGLIAGTAVVLWSERFRRKGFPAFSWSLKAIGSGVLYLSLWAAFQLYHLLPASAALGLMVMVTLWNAWMAWSQDSELLAAYALIGGFATPLLLSSGGNHEIFLFTYILAIDVATIVLVRLKPWPRLLLGTFPATMIFFIGWYAQYWNSSELAVTSVFILLFDSTFSSVPLWPRKRSASPEAAIPEAAIPDSPVPRKRLAIVLEDIFLPIANSAFLALAFYSVLQDSGHHALLPWLMVVLSAVYLLFMRLPQSRVASAIHLSIAIVFLTIAIPLKASGHWITVSWLVEGLALFWVADRLSQSDPVAKNPAAKNPAAEDPENFAPRTLRLLSSGALILGFCGIFFQPFWSGIFHERSFFNANTTTALVGVAVFAAVAWLALRKPSAALPPTHHGPDITVPAFLAIDSIALLLALREIFFTWNSSTSRPTLRSADFLTALIGLGVFAAVVAVALRLRRAQPETHFWLSLAALSIIAFNLVALLTGVREIESLWPPVTDASYDYGLQQALAISAFLMVYGAALLAVGFWKRSAFIRWQALALLVFTIAKTFLYDTRNLSQGYRILSFFGLGALLMAISFAYQKDWLALRNTHEDPDPLFTEPHPDGPIQ